MDSGKRAFRLDYGETHLNISSDADCREAALDELIRHYGLLVDYINRNPVFKASYEPVTVGGDAPEIVKLMAEAAEACHVGPMAAVAGAFSQLVGERIVADGARDVIVENGGDIYLKLSKAKKVGIYAGHSPFSGKIRLRVKAKETPCGICTSSGTVGPSISLGESDSTTAIAESAALADAAATSIGNMIRRSDDVEISIRMAEKIRGLRGVLVIKDDIFGAWGDLPEICGK